MGVALLLLFVLVAIAFGLGAAFEAAWWLFSVLVIGAVVVAALVIGLMRRGERGRTY